MRSSQIISHISHAVLIGLVWQCLNPCSAASEERAAQVEQPGAAKGDQSEVRRAISAWRNKGEKVRTLRVEWDEKYTAAKGAFFRPPENGSSDPKNTNSITAPPTETTYDVSFSILIDEGKIRYVGNSIVVDNLRGALPQKSEWASVGDGKKALDYPGASRFPQGTLMKKDVFISSSDRDNPTLVPVMMGFKPFHPTLTFFEDFENRYEVEPAPVMIEGRSCLQLKEISPSPRRSPRIFYIDPERDYSIVRCTILQQNNKVFHEYTYQTFEQTEFGWFPVKWSAVEMDNDGSIRTSRVATVVNYRINELIEPKEFDLEFPPGTWVTDQQADSMYILQANGNHRRILDREIAQHIPYEQLLITNPGEAVLRDHKASTARWLLLGLINVALVGFIVLMLFLRKRKQHQT